MTETKGVTADIKQKKIAKVSLVALLLILSIFVPKIVLPALAAILFCTVSIVLIYTYVPDSKGKFLLLDRLEEAISKRLQALINLIEKKIGG